MISKLALITAKWFIKDNDTIYKEVETYEYAFFIIYSSIFYLIITLIFGGILKVFIESIIFFIAFLPIRIYAGGYHASTETRCEIISTLSIVASIGIIKISRLYDFYTIVLTIALISASIILLLSPLDTPEKSLTDDEKKYYRKISLVVLLVITTVIIVSYCFKLYTLCIPGCVSLIAEGAFLLLGKIKSSIYKKHNN